MRTNQDLPLDPLGSLGRPARAPAQAPSPAPSKGFEVGDWTKTLPEGLAEKPARDEQSAFEDWATRICPSGDAESVQYQWTISAARAEWLGE